MWYIMNLVTTIILTSCETLELTYSDTCALVIDSTYNILLVRFRHLFDDAWWILVNETWRMLSNKYAINHSWHG